MAASRLNTIFKFAGNTQRSAAPVVSTASPQDLKHYGLVSDYQQCTNRQFAGNFCAANH
jgi:hypothetical protein